MNAGKGKYVIAYVVWVCFFVVVITVGGRFSRQGWPSLGATPTPIPTPVWSERLESEIDAASWAANLKEKYGLGATPPKWRWGTVGETVVFTVPVTAYWRWTVSLDTFLEIYPELEETLLYTGEWW